MPGADSLSMVQDGSMVDEAITGRTALLQLLQSPQVLPRHTDAVGKEVINVLYTAHWL